MRAFLRSISNVCHRHRNGKERINETEVQETQPLLTIQQFRTHDESLTNSTDGLKSSLAAPPPTHKKICLHQVNGQAVTATRQNLNGSRSLSHQSSFAPSKIHSKSLDQDIPTQRSQGSMSDASVLDITQALRFIESQIHTARKLGKRVSRAKVMGTLLSVADHLDVQPTTEDPPLEYEALAKITVIEYNAPQGENHLESAQSSLSYTIDDRSTSTDESFTDDGTLADDVRKQVTWLMDSFVDLFSNAMCLTSPALPPSPKSKRMAVSGKQRNTSQHRRRTPKSRGSLTSSTPTAITFPAKKGFFIFSRFKKSAATKSKKVPPPDPMVNRRTWSRFKTPREKGPRTPRRNERTKRSSLCLKRRDEPSALELETKSRSTTRPVRLLNTRTRGGPASSTRSQNRSIRDPKKIMTLRKGGETPWCSLTARDDAVSGIAQQVKTRWEGSTISSCFPTLKLVELNQYQEALADIFFLETNQHAQQASRKALYQYVPRP